MTIVCGDSHTSTHGAFGALAFGIGTSEVEHVMATQTLPQDKPKTFRINIEGELPHGVTAKDIILNIIGRIGTDGATGHVIEYAGSAIRALSMEGRMTICNMSIEAGARAGMIAPDQNTFAYLMGKRFSPPDVVESRHPERSAAESKDPEGAHITHTLDPLSAINAQRLEGDGLQPAHLAGSSFERDGLQPFCNDATTKSALSAEGISTSTTPTSSQPQAEARTLPNRFPRLTSAPTSTELSSFAAGGGSASPTTTPSSRPERSAVERPLYSDAAHTPAEPQPGQAEGSKTPHTGFPRLTYDEAHAMLLDAHAKGLLETAHIYGDDFGSPDETYISSQFSKPVMVHRYPAAVKAFYMQPDPLDPTKALCVDVLAPEGYGEIIGGSQRVDDYDLLKSRIESHNLPMAAFQWYLDLRKYGSVPHSGFGMGIERCVAWICGLDHVRETIPFPRTLNRIYP